MLSVLRSAAGENGGTWHTTRQCVPVHQRVCHEDHQCCYVVRLHSLSPFFFFCDTHRYTLLYHAHASNKRQTTQSSHSRARLHPKIDRTAIRGKLSGVSEVTSKLLTGNELTLEIQLYEWSKENSFI